MNNIAEDWFSDAKDFLLLCSDAQSQARSERAQEFAGEMVKAAKATGLKTPLSAGQLKYLCTLGDWVVPLLRQRTP